jgi:hypothetical protein
MLTNRQFLRMRRTPNLPEWLPVAILTDYNTTPSIPIVSPPQPSLHFPGRPMTDEYASFFMI